MMNDLDAYQQRAVTTAIYPRDYKVIYPTLGLCGEAGEVAEKIKKIMRDGACMEADAQRDALRKELGDVLWYLANLASDLGISLSSVAAGNLAKLAIRKATGTLQGSGDDR